jgi:hypothetical protein
LNAAGEGSQSIPILIDDNIEHNAIFTAYSSSSHLLDCMAQEDLYYSQPGHHEHRLCVPRWGRPAFVKRQMQAVLDVFYTLQKDFHNIQSLLIL